MNIPKSLLEFARDGRVIPFVGAGASLAIRPGLFPAWHGVLEEMQKKLREEAKDANADLLGIFLTQDRLLDAASEAVRSLGLSGFNGVMRSLFLKTKTESFNLNLQEAIWRLNSKLIVTTNYDSALEWANGSASPLLNSQRHDLAGLLSFSTMARPRVWHLHGHVEDLESLILAPTQYDQFYAQNSGIRPALEAARSQFKALAGNFPFLFIGFGFKDSYVLDMLECVLAEFDGAAMKSYALLQSDASQAINLWNKYNIQVVEYEAHGQPLLSILDSIASHEGSTTVPLGPSKESLVNTGVTSKWPGCTLRSVDTRIENISDLISVLEDSFSFRWERESFQEAPSPIVYWPVRLREPSAIHAVQAFAAAALQLQGAKIVLCLDDLGDRKYEASRFQERIKRWFRRVNAVPSEIEFRQFSEILKTGGNAIAWTHVQQWLGGQNYDLQRVLEICKLYSDGMKIRDFINRGTGRLLTPGVVWACLRRLIDEFDDSSFMTLGGHDECNLWQAWRERVDQGGAKVAHLYIPELSNTHMETTNLKWRAKSDIQNSIEQKLRILKYDSDWQSANEIIKWSISGCVFLPMYVEKAFANAETLVFEPHADAHALVQPAVDKIAEWVL